jgi:hypothetical protein
MTGTLSDLTIHCGGQQFPVHKLLLYTQSSYFRKLFSGPWKVWSATRQFSYILLTIQSQDSNSTILELPDDDPDALLVLIRYFYKNTLFTGFASSSVPRPQEKTGSAFLIYVYAIADKYDAPALRSLVVQRLEETCDPFDDMDDFHRSIAYHRQSHG